MNAKSPSSLREQSVSSQPLICLIAVFTLIEPSFAAEPPPPVPTRPAFPNDPPVVQAVPNANPIEQLNQIQMVPIRPAIRVGPGAAPEKRDWIESWIFNGQTAKNAELQLEAAAMLRIELLKKKADLSPEQIEQAELAAKGDIVRFFRKVDALKDRFKDQRPDRNNMAEIAKEISPVQLQWNMGLDVTQSIFIGVLNASLSREQKASLLVERQTHVDERLKFHALNFVKTVERTVPLTNTQRERLIEMTSQSMSRDTFHPSFEIYLPFQAATKFERSELSSFLDQPQLAAFEKLQEHWGKNTPKIEDLHKFPRSRNQQDWLDAIR